RSFALRPALAAAAGLLTGISPAVTRIHLDGFLSQTSTLFVLPALILLSRREDLRGRERVALSSILLCFQLVSYTELYVLAVFLWCCVSMIRVARHGLSGLWLLLLSVTLSLVLVPGYLRGAVKFTQEQYLYSSNRPQAVESLAPFSGTLKGWAKL